MNLSVFHLDQPRPKNFNFFLFIFPIFFSVFCPIGWKCGSLPMPFHRPCPCPRCPCQGRPLRPDKTGQNGSRTKGIQDKMETGQNGSRTRLIQDKMDPGQYGSRTIRNQDNKEPGQSGSRTIRIQDNKDPGQ